MADGKWAYLASWLDLFSRRIVGWWVDKHMKESLIVQAFDQALQQRQPKPGLIVHCAGSPLGSGWSVFWSFFSAAAR
ncbi:DDE-type integrase/transposase/recombinase [Larkinella harenae]